MIKFFNDIENEAEGSTQVVPIFAEIHTETPDQSQLQTQNLDGMPVMALRDMVMFPGSTLPIAVTRAQSLALIKDVQRNNRPIAVVCQRDSSVEEPKLNDLYSVGVVANLIKVLQLPDKSTNVILQGRSLVRLEELTQTEPFLKGRCTLVEETQPEKGDREFDAVISSMREVTMKMLQSMGQGARELMFAIKNIDDPVYLIHFLATNIPLTSQQKQSLLEQTDVKRRAFMLHHMLKQEAQFVELKADINERTREEMTQQQREHFLQQQLKTIQEELGADDDIPMLEERAAAMKWSEATAAHFEKELRKLERLHPQSPDYSTQYSYLDTLLNLPWNKYSRDSFNLKKVEVKLNRDHYGLDDVKDRILEHLSVLKLRGDLKAPILCLYGPPGVGKTSLGRSVAEALNRKYERISLGGLHDEAEIRGHRRTYIGALPGRIMQAMAKCGTSNPVIVLDEIDKVGQDFKGDPASALLEVLDPEQNSHFHDNYIDVDYDLSKVLFIATANSLATISKPLLDRMEVIEINSYIAEEKIEIARRHLVPKQLAENGFEPREVKFTKEAIETIVSNFTRESGVRELEKKIAKVLRKIARKKASGDPFPTTVEAAALKDYLGVEYPKEQYEGNDLAGVVTGLAWTEVGGEILFIESVLSRGKGEKLSLTGNLGDIMKESAVIALQYLKSHSQLFGINPELFDKYNVHIHVPDGAIPKDGPSAGVTMVTSLVSSFTQRRVRDHLAMTGEITLRGKVTPVGGIKEKILAAKRAGITDIVLCEQNRKDVEQIKDIYLKGLTFHYVNTIKEVVDFALLDECVPDALTL